VAGGQAAKEEAEDDPIERRQVGGLWLEDLRRLAEVSGHSDPGGQK
jgi:hypothetical protein